MLQLNQRKISTNTREFEYELPDYLAKEGKCWLKVTAKAQADVEMPMRHAVEKHLNANKASVLLLERHRERAVSMADDPLDLDDENVSKAFQSWAAGDTKNQQRLNRALTLECFNIGVVEWSTNIHDNATALPVEPTPDAFKDMVNLAYPDGGISSIPELTIAFNKFRKDIAGKNGGSELIEDDDAKNL